MAERPNDDYALLTDDIRELPRIIAQSDIVELSIERGDSRLHLKRGSTALPAALAVSAAAAPQLAASQSAAAPPAAPGQLEMPAGFTITAPMVGTFYSAPSPKEPPFIQEGDEVHPGDVVGIIEAMKMMNEIESETAGRLARILVKNGQPVEYGQPLMVVEPL
jgi:acetyl-CoA carboxylase biotin carboxyl carrier protein